MKSKFQAMPHTSTSKKPAKAQVSDAEFRRRLKNISEWRKKRLLIVILNNAEGVR